MTSTRDARALRAVYFCYLGANALVGTYWPWHLDALGWSGVQIGLLFSVRAILMTAAQPVLTGWADHRGLATRTLQVGLLFGVVVSAFLPLAESFVLFAGLVWLAAPGFATVIPLLDASVVQRFGTKNYGRSRLWGSLGYGLAALIFGRAVMGLDYETAGALAVKAFVVVLALASVASFAVSTPRRAPMSREERPEVSMTPALATFLVVNGLHWAGVMVFNIYFGMLVEHREWSPALPGVAMAVAIAAEVLALGAGARLLAWRPALSWLAPVFVISAIRWLATAWAPTPGVILVVQVLHGVSFGVWFVAMMDGVSRFADDDRRPTLQGWVAAAVLGGGGVISTALGGALMDVERVPAWLEGPPFAFAAASLLELLAVLGVLAFARSWEAVESPSRPAEGA